MPEITGAPAAAGDMPLIEEALTAEGLPTRDLCDGATNFFVFQEHGDGLVGFAGLQQVGAAALLRSLVVLPPARARACGLAIVRWMVSEAQRRARRPLCAPR